VANVDLTQAEADALIALPKIRVDDERYDFPKLGGAVHIPLSSKDKREQFLLDISRGRIDLQKCTYQNRARQVIILLRLDLGGAPHRNPDGQEMSAPHLHVYREGYGDKWAMPVPANAFSDTGDLWQTLQDFMRYCNITDPPFIEKGLFT
jgi:hypothetical protein